MNAPFRQPDTAARTATLHLFAFFHLNLAFSSIEEGQRAEVIEGLREYEIRDSARFRAYVNHMVKAPHWQGEDLTGKRILIAGEQGLGDEFMFANIRPIWRGRLALTGNCRLRSIRVLCL
jgi:hypothetical protein